MKRKITFRGKPVDGFVDWVHGSLLYLGEDKYAIVPLHGEPINVIPETVSQFAELNDKNGVDIYEGSIFSNGSFVIWHGCAFVLQTKLGKFPLCKSNIDGLMVIGNIHDDTELLK